MIECQGLPIDLIQPENTDGISDGIGKIIQDDYISFSNTCHGNEIPVGVTSGGNQPFLLGLIFGFPPQAP